MSLFILSDEPRTLHSGDKTRWFIDCDELTDSDIDALAHIGRNLVPDYGPVVGIARGGLRLADKMRKYATDGSPTVLIVDDVLTTGASMEECRSFYPGAVGLVIFARGNPPAWVTPIWRM